jgi:hypothetical protein
MMVAGTCWPGRSRLYGLQCDARSEEGRCHAGNLLSGCYRSAGGIELTMPSRDVTSRQLTLRHTQKGCLNEPANSQFSWPIMVKSDCNLISSIPIVGVASRK